MIAVNSFHSVSIQNLIITVISHHPCNEMLACGKDGNNAISLHVISSWSAYPVFIQWMLKKIVYESYMSKVLYTKYQTPIPTLLWKVTPYGDRYCGGSLNLTCKPFCSEICVQK